MKSTTPTQDNLEAEIGELQEAIVELEQRNRVLEERILEIFALYNVSKALNHTLQLEDLFKVTIQMMTGSMRVTEFGIYLFDRQIGRLNPMAVVGTLEEKLVDLQLPVDRGILGEAFSTGMRVEIENTFNCTTTDEWTQEGGYHAVAIPLKIEAGEVVGAMVLRNHGGGSFKEEDIDLFESAAQHLAHAIENARVYQETKELSFLDPVTRVYNQRYVEERLSREQVRASRYDHPLQIIMVRAKGIDQVTAKMGQPVANRLLRAIAETIHARLRRSDIMGHMNRTGEFGILLPETSHTGGRLVLETLLQSMIDRRYAFIPEGTATIEYAGSLASLPEDESALDDLFALARQRLS